MKNMQTPKRVKISAFINCSSKTTKQKENILKYSIENEDTLNSVLKELQEFGHLQNIDF